MIKLGNKVRDKVTGLEGIVVARTEFLNGCVRLTIQPRPLKKDGSLPDEKWFDDKQLELVGKGVSVESSPTGGPTSIQPPRGLRS